MLVVLEACRHSGCVLATLVQSSHARAEELMMLSTVPTPASYLSCPVAGVSRGGSAAYAWFGEAERVASDFIGSTAKEGAKRRGCRLGRPSPRTNCERRRIVTRQEYYTDCGAGRVEAGVVSVWWAGCWGGRGEKTADHWFALPMNHTYLNTMANNHEAALAADERV